MRSRLGRGRQNGREKVVEKAKASRRRKQDEQRLRRLAQARDFARKASQETLLDRGLNAYLCMVQMTAYNYTGEEKTV